MCGPPGTQKRLAPKKETGYLDALVRGVYARRDLPVGYIVFNDDFHKDFYMAVPLQKGQMSCREVMSGEKLLKALPKDKALVIDNIDSPYSKNEELKN